MKKPHKVKFNKPEHMAKLINKAVATFYAYIPVEFATMSWITPMCKSNPKNMPKALMRIHFKVAKALEEYRRVGPAKFVKIDMNDTYRVNIGVDEFGKVFVEDETKKRRSYDLNTIPGAKSIFA